MYSTNLETSRKSVGNASIYVREEQSCPWNHCVTANEPLPAPPPALTCPWHLRARLRWRATTSRRSAPRPSSGTILNSPRIPGTPWLGARIIETFGWVGECPSSPSWHLTNRHYQTAAGSQTANWACVSGFSQFSGAAVLGYQGKLLLVTYYVTLNCASGCTYCIYACHTTLLSASVWPVTNSY